MIGEAVFARCLSSLKEERVEASKNLKGPKGAEFNGDKKVFLEDIRQVCLNHPFKNVDSVALLPLFLAVQQRKGSVVCSSSIINTMLCVFRLSMPPRSSRMPRGSCCSDRQPKSLAGRSTMVGSL